MNYATSFAKKHFCAITDGIELHHVSVFKDYASFVYDDMFEYKYSYPETKRMLSALEGKDVIIFDDIGSISGLLTHCWDDATIWGTMNKDTTIRFKADSVYCARIAHNGRVSIVLDGYAPI